MFQKKFAEQYQNKNFMFKNFSSKVVPFMM